MSRRRPTQMPSSDRHPFWRLIALALVVAWTGAHWTLLQTIAWSGMLVDYAAEEGLSAGIVKTFDGQSPCKLCVIVENYRSAEGQEAGEELQLQPKPDWIFDAPSAVLFSRQSSRTEHVLSELTGDCLGESPPKPPPRSVSLRA